MTDMWARIENGTVAEITDLDPAGRFHPSLKWVECNSNVKQGWKYEGGSFSEHVSLPTYQEELQILNADYQKDVEAFNKALSLAILFDGVTEDDKKASIREQYNNRKQKYVSDIAALKLKHGV